MPAPKPDAPRCDVVGCGTTAATSTDGAEKDSATRRETKVSPEGVSYNVDVPLNRPALPNLNVCPQHINWPHSEDAKVWIAQNAAVYNARKGSK